MNFHSQRSIMHIHHLLAGVKKDSSTFINVSRKTKLSCMVALSILILTIIAIVLSTLYGTQGIDQLKFSIVCSSLKNNTSTTRLLIRAFLLLSDIDACDPDPCLFNEICEDHINSFHCQKGKSLFLFE